MEEFRNLGLSENIIKTLEQKGFKEPTPIQTKTIPVLLEGKLDVIGKAQTGTGKTACFALPILESIKENSKGVKAIILTPTRELAIQVAKEIDSLKGKRKIKVSTIYGGASITTQLSELKRGVDIVVGTPGRTIDVIKRKALDISNISFAVLDEADEMLNMGFIDDIKMILSKTTSDKKMLFFSATMPREILKIAQKFMREFVVLEVENPKQENDLIKQVYYDINSKDRVEGLRRIIGINRDFYGIIFCKTKATVDSLIKHLQKEGMPAAALHGDISQGQREKILLQFRNKFITILVATDVAARGIDVNDLTHVINYSLPQSPETYIHRIGRTGRAGKEGHAITFVTPREKRDLKQLEKISRCKIEQAKIPDIEDVISAKKSHIITIIDEIMEKGKLDEFNQVSEMILGDKEPQKVISAVLKFAFKNELNASKYKSVKPVEPFRGGRGGSRGGRGGFSRGGSRGGYRGNRSGSRGGYRGRSGSSNGRGNFSSRGNSRSGSSRGGFNRRSDSRDGNSQGGYKPRGDSRGRGKSFSGRSSNDHGSEGKRSRSGDKKFTKKSKKFNRN